VCENWEACAGGCRRLNDASSPLRKRCRQQSVVSFHRTIAEVTHASRVVEASGCAVLAAHRFFQH
jgi:hypothetical protein